MAHDDAAEPSQDSSRRDLRRRPKHSELQTLEQRLAHADDLITARWTLKIMRCLKQRDCRFSQIKAMIPDISANLLSRRLKELEEAGVVIRVLLPSPANCWIYRLSPIGSAAAPLLDAIQLWAKALPQRAVEMTERAAGGNASA